jgi:hypothetical protein
MRVYFGLPKFRQLHIKLTPSTRFAAHRLAAWTLRPMDTREIGWKSAPPETRRKSYGRKSITLAARLAILCTVCLFPAGHLFAQAAPGPMAPAQPQPPSQQSAPPRKEQAVEARKTLAGFWKLNSDESDDANKKLEDARRSAGGMGGGRRVGGGYPFPGRGGPYGGGRRIGGPDAENRERTEDMIKPADSLTIVLKDPEVDMTSDQGRKLVFYTDGRKTQKSKDDTAQEISARWNGGQLVSDEKSARGEKMSRTFELSSDGLQLSETWRIENSRSNSPLVIRYVYDAASQSRQ